MEINNQHIKIKSMNQELNAKSMEEKADCNIEQSKEYGKNLNFTGLRNMRIKNISVSAIKKTIADSKPLYKSQSEHFKEAYDHVFPEFSSEIKYNDIIQIAKENNLKAKSKRFLINMMQQGSYYAQAQNRLVANNKIRPEEKVIDSPEIILDLFKRVKNPTDIHNEFVNSIDLSMTDIKKCFDACDDKPLKLKKLLSVRKDIETAYVRNHKMFGSKESHNMFMDFVNSPNLDEYLQNYEKLYRGHITRGVRKENHNVIGTLDKLRANNNIILEARDMAKFEHSFKDLSESAEGTINPDKFLKYHSVEGDELLYVLSDKFKPTKEYIRENSEKDFVDIYRTTTKNNLEFRTKYLENMYYSTIFQKDTPKDEIKSVKKLFEMTDKNSKAQEFVQKVLKNGFKVNSSAELVTILEKHGANTLNMRSKGVLDVMNQNKDGYVEKVSEYLETSAPSLNERVSVFFKKLCDKGAEMGLKIKKPAKHKHSKYIYPDEYYAPKKEEIKIFAEEIKPELPIITVNKEEKTPEIKQVKKHFSLAESNKQKLLDIIANPPSNTMSKKLKISQGSILPELKKNIKSEKLLNEQGYIYTVNATKMRANMLPDIFESIKVTRAQAKAANGGKLPKDFVKNEDAIDLYTKINGKNKKLVEYMLKQTKKDENGKTVKAFNVKDIIKTLENGNRDIIRAKKAATKENRFTSKDEKAIFDRMLGDLKTEYGELSKKPKVKKNK